MKNTSFIRALSAGLALSFASVAQSADPAGPFLQAGDKLMIIGDSITEGNRYTQMVETYLMGCSGLADLQVFTCGWIGDTSGGFANKQESAYNWFKPTAAMSFMGMNSPDDPEKLEPHKKGCARIAAFMTERNVKMLIGSPGAVYPDQWKSHESKNKCLGLLGDMHKDVAAQYGQRFADIHNILMPIIPLAKEKYGTPGQPYQLFGIDGCHAGDNGSFLFAYGFLKAMNLDGSIGSITLDYATGKATVSEGITQTAALVGGGDFTSTRYPYCFRRDTAEMLAFIDFQKELNQFILKVTNFPAEQGNVAFGSETKGFTKAELEAGINLADYMENPFKGPFFKLMGTIAAKESYETYIFKSYLNKVRNHYEADNAKAQEGFRLLDEITREKWLTLDANVRAAVAPVPFSLRVTPVE